MTSLNWICCEMNSETALPGLLLSVTKPERRKEGVSQRNEETENESRRRPELTSSSRSS